MHEPKPLLGKRQGVIAFFLVADIDHRTCNMSNQIRLTLR